MSAFSALLQRDLALAWRQRADVINPLGFFVIATSLFPLGMGPEPALLVRLGPGAVWIAALLAVLLSLEGLFRADRDDGSLEQHLLSPAPLPLSVLARLVAHWIITVLPLLLVAPLLAMMLGIEGTALRVLIVSLALGMPTLCAIGAIGAALTVGLPRGGVLVALLVLPLYVPVLVFGAGAVQGAAQGFAVAGQLAVLGALLALSVALAPFAIAGALRIGGSQ